MHVRIYCIFCVDGGIPSSSGSQHEKCYQNNDTLMGAIHAIAHPRGLPVQTHVLFSPEVIANIKNAIEKCTPPSIAGVIGDIIKLVEEGGVPEDDNFKELLHCAFQTAGYANEDGTMNIEKAASDYPDPSAIVNLIEKCSKNIGTSVENTFYYFKVKRVTTYKGHGDDSEVSKNFNILVLLLSAVLVSTGDIERIVIHFPSGIGEAIKAVIASCGKNDADFPELVKLIREGKYREDEEFKKFVHCSYKDSGFVFDDGRVDIEAASQIFPDPKRIYKIMKECNEKRETPVETTYQYFKCFQDNTPFLLSIL
ncbi:Odorant binding protein [Operophtera brumata]|uniref:Odorant binding protein n=1 Tax=Operophtera brumata TaxID=104452 RepID=A0A0L7L7A8_OPEBR|nr:Odorant binding protein [Operophtera brumata]